MRNYTDKNRSCSSGKTGWTAKKGLQGSPARELDNRECWLGSHVSLTFVTRGFN